MKKHMQAPLARAAPGIMGAIFVLYFGLVAGSVALPGDTLFTIVPRISETLSRPSAIRITQYTPRAVLICLGLYGFAVLVYVNMRGNRRPGQEHGSAKFMHASRLTAGYRDKKEPASDVPCSQHVRMGRNSKQHLANRNRLIIGGPGSRKTTSIVLPTILQGYGSYIITDPKGELLRSTGTFLKAQGIEVSVLNLVDMARSDGYNPFRYIREPEDILRLVTNLIKNTTPANSRSNDPFWERAETALIEALMFYLWQECDESSQDFATLVELIESCGASEADENEKFPMDILFEQLEEEDPHSIALQMWRVFKQSRGRTAQSILVAASVRLAHFILPQFAALTERDELDIGSLGLRQRYLFCVIPDNDTSFNFLISMLYTQVYQELYRVAATFPDIKLPVPVRVVMDEFANIALPDDFSRILNTCRSREIYIDVIIQALAQLKGLFADGKWEAISGSCATLVYLGGNEQSTHEYISKMLGKDTIDTRSYGLQRGMRGSSSRNDTKAGRELLTPDEVRGLDKDVALVLVQGERPVADRKFNMRTHPNFKLTAYGGQREPYIHPLRDTVTLSGDLEDVPSIDGLVVEYAAGAPTASRTPRNPEPQETNDFD